MFYNANGVSIGEFKTLNDCMEFPIHNIWCINREDDNLFSKYKAQGFRVIIICCWNRIDHWRFVVGIIKGGKRAYFDLNDLPMNFVVNEYEAYLGKEAMFAISKLDEHIIIINDEIRLTESQLRQIISTCIKNILH